MDISLLEKSQVDFFWFKLKDYFKEAAKYTHGRYTAQDLKNKLKEVETQQLWVAHVGEEIYGFAITDIIDYPQMRALTMQSTAGKEFNKWHHQIIELFREYAKSNGCDTIESLGRDGWAKVFKNDGYNKMCNYFELPVEAP